MACFKEGNMGITLWQPFVKKHSFHLKIGCAVTIDLNCFKVQSKDSEFLALSHSR